MHLYLAQIILYHRALWRRSEPVPWHHVPRADKVDEESACIKAAIDAIGYTSSNLEQDDKKTIPWHSAYIVYISAVTLLTAAPFLDRSDRVTIEGAVRTAMLVLSNATYGSWHAKSCYLQFTQVSPIFYCPILPPSTSLRLTRLFRINFFRSLTCLTDIIQHNQCIIH